MKKAIILALGIVILFSFSVVNVSAYEYEFFDLECYIPEYYYEVDGETWESYRFVTEDDEAELKLFIDDNYEDLYVDVTNLHYIAEHYIECRGFEADQYSFKSVIDTKVDECPVALISGTINADGEERDCYTYFIPSGKFVYFFEFAVGDEYGTSYIPEVINSIDIDDDDIVELYGVDDLISDIDFEEIFGVVVFLIISVIGSATVKILKKATAPSGKSTTAADGKQNTGLPTTKFTDKKFELNGRKINALNERFTVGKADDNFAKSELEKERREREKMFD